MNGDVRIHERETDWGRVGKVLSGAVAVGALGYVGYEVATEVYANRATILKIAGLTTTGISTGYIATREVGVIARRTSNNRSIGAALGLAGVGAAMTFTGLVMERGGTSTTDSSPTGPLDTVVSVQGTNLVDEPGQAGSIAERNSTAVATTTTGPLMMFLEQGTITESDNGRNILVPLPPIAETRGDGVCIDPETIKIPDGGSYWAAMRGNDAFNDLTDDDLTDITRVSDFMQKTMLHAGDSVDFACP